MQERYNPMYSQANLQIFPSAHHIIALLSDPLRVVNNTTIITTWIYGNVWRTMVGWYVSVEGGGVPAYGGSNRRALELGPKSGQSKTHLKPT